MAVAFGKYLLLKKLASGGMGQVFLAREPGGPLRVVKRILPHLVEDESALARFLEEGRLLGGLDHPNLVQLYELGQANGSFYLALEYVQGEDLGSLIRYSSARGAPIPLGVSLRIIAAAAAGLDHAHQARDGQGRPLGLVHRDVSPRNLLVGFDGRVKLIDFGLAKPAGGGPLRARGGLEGNAAYLSPEGAEDKPLDRRADLFSLGVVLWELLTGKRLFKAESRRATLRRVLDCHVPPPSELNPQLPAGLDALVLKALARRPEDRLQDAAALGSGLEAMRVHARLPASEASLVAWLSELYAARIEHESKPANLDELQADPDLESAPSDGRAAPPSAQPGPLRR